MWIWAVVGVVVALFVVLKLKASYRSPSQLEAIKKALAADAPLVDVRSKAEFSGSHLSRAINVPVAELPGSLKKVGRPKKPVVVYCATGSRSAMAARTLRANGFEQVLDLGPLSNGSKIGR
ncbi:MAG: rhodanese-like domain-containing protein [Deltaproteobacteria bacterium CG_4_9_14_3_um_filter_63_12]|nr:MAG: rhodanese-like domain-containing protein [Deltaproteobacteria bacterium CG_4_9_14_3_um_filter_63_12]